MEPGNRHAGFRETHTSEEAVNRADGEEKSLLHQLELEMNVDEPVSTWQDWMSGASTLKPH